MKKLFIGTLAVLMAFSVFAAPQAMRQGKEGRRGKDKAGMIFKLAEKFRVDLNLTADQNQKLDDLLIDLKDYRKSIMEKMKAKKQDMIDSFVSDDFNPEAMQEDNKAEREAFREEARKFMTAKVKELHDLLTKEQRQKLVDLAKAAREKMRGERRFERRKFRK